MRARTNSIVLSARNAAPLSAAYITRRLPRTRNSAISSLWIAVAFVRTRSVATPFASAANLKMTQQHLSQGLKQFANILDAGKGGISTTASTTGANLNHFQSGKSMKSRKQPSDAHKRKNSIPMQYDPQAL